MALGGCAEVRSLTFDLPGRRLQIGHDGPVQPISERLVALNLGARLAETRTAEPGETAVAPNAGAQAAEAASLKWLLLINAGMFIFELVAGLLAGSAGLIGDSLDMFADAAVYGVALLAVGKSLQHQLRAARVAGVLQLILALGLLLEVGRRFAFGSEPESVLMMAVSLVALLANVTCLLLIARHRDAGVHMKASWIFSANDVLINLGDSRRGAGRLDRLELSGSVDRRRDRTDRSRRCPAHPRTAELKRFRPVAGRSSASSSRRRRAGSRRSGCCALPAVPP
jgi:hypothetical protein